MVLPDLPTHAEAQGYHIVLLTVPRATAFDVVKQGCLQGTTLQRSKVSTRLSRAGLNPLVLKVPLNLLENMLHMC